MEIDLFFLGALGALLTVYLAKQEVIPEFRPLFDTASIDSEIREQRERIDKTQADIDAIEAKLQEDSVDKGLAERLKAVLAASLAERQGDRATLRALEREIIRSQLISRTLGFAFYIVLGGVFGSLLAEKVQVEGLSGDLPDSFQSIVIGATWTTYLSAIGIRAGQDKIDERIEANNRKTTQEIDAFKKSVTARVSEIVASAELAEKVTRPVLAGEVAKMLEDEIDRTNLAVQRGSDVTRQMVRRDAKGLL